MTVDVIDSISATTYNAPVVHEEAKVFALSAGYENIIESQNRTRRLIYTGTYLTNFFEPTTNNMFPGFLKFFNAPPLVDSQLVESTLTLTQARDIAIASLMKAEKKRQEEGKQEARFWANLDGEQ